VGFKVSIGKFYDRSCEEDPYGPLWRSFNGEGKEKVLLNLKVDGLQKHANKQKALVGHSRVPLHEYYMNNDSQH
jgi:hypothetical protein